MRTIPILVCLVIAPMMGLAQNDTIPPPAPPETPMPPVAPVAIEPSEGDTLQGERRALWVGVNSKEGGFVKIEEGDTTKRKDPVIINTKRRTIRIYSEPKVELDTAVKVMERRKELKTERRNLFTYWSGLDIGVNTLLGPDNDAELGGAEEFMQIDQGRSRFFAINFMEQKLEFGTHHVGLMTGLGVEFANYHLRNNVLLAYNSDSIYGIPVESPEFRKNKLRQMGIRVPLMLEFNTKRAPIPSEAELASGKKFSYDRKGNFHIAMGVVGSWYFDTMYKQKYRLDEGARKERDKGDYLLLPYRAAASVRVGYGALNLFAEYGLTSFFKDDKGPQLTPFNVGLTIVGFN